MCTPNFFYETQLIADFLNQNGHPISSYNIHGKQNKDVEMHMLPFPFTPHDQNVGSRQMSADWRVDQ
jgi:hypothetical protein